MTGWIISIVGMVLTVTLTEIMLPEGQTAKYIKGVISLIVVYVVIAPIPALLQSKIDINSFFDFAISSYESDECFIGIINEDKQSLLSENMQDVFRKSGLKSASAEIILGWDDSVNCVLLTASKEDMDAAYRLTVECLGVKEEQIVINEIFT